MSQTITPPTLEQHVGSVVDPIAACPSRKLAMREELLAHLVGAYEEELAESRSHETALASAKTRFGNLQILSEELGQSVPLLERLIFQFLTPREPLMLRWILVGLACLAIGLGLILPALAKIKAGEKFTAGAAIPFSIGVAIAVIGLASAAYKVFKRLSSRDQTVTPR